VILAIIATGVVSWAKSQDLLPSRVDDVELDPVDFTPRRISTNDIPGVDAGFRFDVEVPWDWEAEAIPAIQAINFYAKPSTSGFDRLEESQIFVRQFSASSFLTLSTVDIFSREEQTIVGRPAVRYDIQKKSGVADFPNQPSWRNDRHIVTDIRVSDSSLSIFYVIAKRPDLDETIYQNWLASLILK